MSRSSKVNLRRAYKATKRELNELLSQRQKLEGKIVTARKTLQSLASVCEAAGLRVESSSEAAYLLKSELGDEVRSILIANYPSWTRPNQVVAELERMGHDLGKFANPQASIQMILKRMVEAEEAQEAQWPEDGKKIYRIPRSDGDRTYPTVGMTLAKVPGRMVPLSNLSGQFDMDKLPDEIRQIIAPTGPARSRNVFADRFAVGRPTRETATAALEAIEKNRKR
jgi:hypothetical protein